MRTLFISRVALHVAHDMEFTVTTMARAIQSLQPKNKNRNKNSRTNTTRNSSTPPSLASHCLQFLPPLRPLSKPQKPQDSRHTCMHARFLPCNVHIAYRRSFTHVHHTHTHTTWISLLPLHTLTTQFLLGTLSVCLFYLPLLYYYLLLSSPLSIFRSHSYSHSSSYS